MLCYLMLEQTCDVERAGTIIPISHVVKMGKWPVQGSVAGNNRLPSQAACHHTTAVCCFTVLLNTG